MASIPCAWHTRVEAACEEPEVLSEVKRSKGEDLH